jgi:hypothetical protein
VGVVIGAREAHARHFKWESETKESDARDAEKTKPRAIRDQLTDNKIRLVLFPCRRNSDPNSHGRSFSSHIAAPALAVRKVEGAKDSLRFMVGQELRGDAMPTADLDAETPFGPATESFFCGSPTGKHNCGESGGVLNNIAIADVKTQVLLCVHFMLENLR